MPACSSSTFRDCGREDVGAQCSDDRDKHDEQKGHHGHPRASGEPSCVLSTCRFNSATAVQTAAMAVRDTSEQEPLSDRVHSNSIRSARTPAVFGKSTAD
jgi:hypothetical protein